MLPGKMFLAEDSTFQICGVPHFSYIYVYTENYEVTDSVRFPNNILIIEMLFKSPIFYVKLCLTQLP